MRSLTGCNVRLSDFEQLPDNSFLLKRIERKCGKTRNCSKPVYVKLVPHKVAEVCPLIHIARHISNNSFRPNDQIFAIGFTRKEQQSDEAFAKCIQRRFIAVLHAVFIAVGKVDGIGEKKLHIFRTMCENDLGSLGIRSSERQEYIGWSDGAQMQNYSLIKHRALNSSIPYIISERKTKDDDLEHPL